MADRTDPTQFEGYFRDPRIQDGRLRVGVSGTASRNVRLALRQLGGYRVGEGELYDESDAEAISQFQAKNGHEHQDGICGRRTRLLIVEKLIEKLGTDVFSQMCDPRQDTRYRTSVRSGQHSIFLSHVEEDKETALALASELQKKGYPTWCYENDTLPGVSYLVQTGKAIESARVFLLLISSASLDSHQVTKEVVRAHEEGKPIVPLLVDVSHAEFQRRQPEWREAVGGAASLSVATHSFDSLIAILIKSFDQLGVPMVSKPG
jgi:peptidoglycan hydrolase-like protein with peptidoglycan-binding domain